MAQRKREYDDDDGRTIADMSGVDRPNLLGFRRPPERQEGPAQGEFPEQREERPWEDSSMNRDERRMYVLGALKAALLIALAFIVGLGLAIALMLLLWT